ncbi:hypothetical protein ENU1_180640 [Entamoeba nuttalli P19]|uniref:TLDc domain-containing protein n=1 Tax=Entamoeba nuttalli (strain P19) TaxID=1076696 RepID=K2G6E2_ENTNP|nr:hypothetical protein ENU1_180640 [Entamoeba nuttalli P19]EKE37971.1 hypothetical protein ENU1_180640 [Entamoeba nuttalli P19]|eukprot:XP_008859692.1 hypothetical protein ENU1_180640 [Entamoeba nuttalli P19]
MNKEHITIIIEDSKGNTLGGYVNSKIDKVNDYITDSKPFVFSLESNGMKGMKKFDIKEQQYAFYLWNKSSDYLFGFGDVIFVFIKKIIKQYQVVNIGHMNMKELKIDFVEKNILIVSQRNES